MILDDINRKLNDINHKRQKRKRCRTMDYDQIKQRMIDDIKEVIAITGTIKWINPSVVWTTNYFIDTHNHVIAWNDLSIDALQSFVSDMNSMFIFGFGSNQIVENN